MFRRLFLITILFVVIHIVYAQETHWMPDPALRQAVREEMGVPAGVPVGPEDIAKVVRLNVESMDIVDLTGLERFVNLENIVAHHNRILRPLAGGSSPFACGIDESDILDIKLQHYFRCIALSRADQS